MPMEPLQQHILGHRERWIDLLQKMVNIDCGSYDKAGVDAVGELATAELAALGFDVETIHEEEHGNHRRGRKAGGSPRILLVGHLDTVFERGAAGERPFTIRDGKAYGPGVLDMKGGIVSMLAALSALRDTDSPGFTKPTITVFFNSEEEILSPRSRPYLEAEAKQSDMAIVFEPARPGGEYVTQRKATGKLKLKVYGRAAHAGVQPEYGASAIHALAYKIAALRELSNLETGTTINVGVIRGGERSNVVAPYAEAEIDLRAWTQAEADVAIAAMREIASATSIPGTRGELEGGVLFPAMERSSKSDEIMARFKTAGQEIGLEVRDTKTGGGSDANYISIHTPTFDGVGPVGAYAHSPDEFMEIETLFERAAVTSRALELSAERYGH